MTDEKKCQERYRRWYTCPGTKDTRQLVCKECLKYPIRRLT